MQPPTQVQNFYLIVRHIMMFWAMKHYIDNSGPWDCKGSRGLGRCLSGQSTCIQVLGLEFRSSEPTETLRKYGGWPVIPAPEGRDRILSASWLERLAVFTSSGFARNPQISKMEEWLRMIPDTNLGPPHARTPMWMCTHTRVFTHLQIRTHTYTWARKKEKNAVMS